MENWKKKCMSDIIVKDLEGKTNRSMTGW